MKKWLILFVAVLIAFRGAFFTYIFQDDFFGFGISKINNLTQFLRFFNIFRGDRFYRPLSTEVFYFFVQAVNNLIITRIFVFSIFFIGLIFLYKIIFNLTKKSGLAFLTIVIYSLSFTHVFQLYWLSTFQEIALFTFSCLATYFFINKKLITGLFFFLAALLSKESAVSLPFLLLIITLKNYKVYHKKLFFYFLLIIPFIFIYKTNYVGIELKPEYALNFSPKLIGNNLLWYGLWSFGLPNFFPDFITSIFSGFPGNLSTAIINARAIPYLVFWTFFTSLLLLTIVTNRSKKLLLVGIVCLAGFLIFILPVSIIVHKWIVRLTIPVIFSSFFLAYLISSSKKWVGVSLLFFYILYNIFAVPVHENTSTYKYESSIGLKAQKILVKNNCIYFSDESEAKSGWEGSQKLKLTLFDQWFAKYYWSNKNIKVYYGFETKTPPDSCTIIDSKNLL